MSADTDYSARTVRRLRLLALTAFVSYLVSAASFYPFCWHFCDRIGPFAPLALAGAGALLTAAGITTVMHYVISSIWPEDPDEE